MKIFNVLLFLTFFSYSLAAQYSSCYYYFVAKGDNYYFKKNYLKAHQLYKKAIKTQPDVLLVHTYNIARTCLCQKDTTNALKYIKEAIVKGGVEWSFFDDFACSDFIKTHPKWLQLKTDYPNLRKQYLATTHNDIYLKINELYITEQYIRNNIYRHKDSTTWVHVKKVDSINIKTLTKIVKTSGFPKLEKIGYYGLYKLNMVLFHSLTNNKTAWKFFKPQLLQAIKAGDFLPIYYAEIVDRQQSSHKEQHLYGEYNLFVPNEKYYAPIQDIQNLDKRRLELGLITLKERTEFSPVQHFLPSNYQPIEQPTSFLGCPLD